MSNNIEKLDSIAIVSMTGRFPGAQNTEEFWNNLKNSIESISHVPDEKNPSMIHADGILNDIDKFDASFFDYSPREAEIIDPQHRVFLEEAWKVLELAGYTSDKYDGKIAIFAGSNMSGYLIRNLYSHPDLVEQLGTFKTMLANGQDFLSTRASYKMNLTGPSVNVNTLCSSSLVAVHYACNSLLDYSSDIAIAGGVNLQVSRSEALFYQEGGIGASDGHCRAFDSKANGTVSGSGIAVVVLKRLEDALEDGDTIHAIIRGSAVNNDGANKNSYTAPNADGQAECIAEAIEMAEVNPETISYIETHGTGTNLGDPIEIAGLTKAFSAYTDKKQFCAIGSVKTNIGHLVTAGGAASLVKTVLAIENKLLPESLNFEKPNPKINFEETPFFVNTKLKEWKSNETPLRAGISSFGIGGTNAHIIIEEAPETEPSSESREYQVLTLSAKTQSALDRMNDNLKKYLQENKSVNIADVSFTLNTGRKDFDYRKVFIFDNIDNLIDEKNIETYSLNQKQTNSPAIFLFPGTGERYINTARDLYNTENDFKTAINLCFEIISKESGIDLKTIIFPSDSTANDKIDDKKITKLSCFVIEYSIAKLLESWQIIPEYILGNDIGEFTGACFSGIFSLEDALKILCSDEQDYINLLEKIEMNIPEIKLISSTQGNFLSEEDAVNKEYWIKILGKQTGTDAGLKYLVENTNGILIEIGDGNYYSESAKKAGINNLLKIINEHNSKTPGIKTLMNFTGEYWINGGKINWNDFYKDERRMHIPLPTYPFERQSYWIEPLKPGDKYTKQGNDASVLQKLKLKPRPDLEIPYQEPKSETEKFIVKKWEEALGIEGIGINDNFYDLGGHSLIAASIAASLAEIFKVQIPLNELLELPTVSELAELVDSYSWALKGNESNAKFEGEI